jgi:hypothetical protein
MPKTKHDPEEVNAYLAELPDDERATLQDLQLLIKGTVPDGEVTHVRGGPHDHKVHSMLVH